MNRPDSQFRSVCKQAILPLLLFAAILVATSTPAAED